MRERDLVLVISEALPFSKSGGLGDVGGGLPMALGRLGHRVTLVLPNYRGSRTRGGGICLSIGTVTGCPDVRVIESRMTDNVRSWLDRLPAVLRS